MGKIVQEFETKYDVGDVVIFGDKYTLQVGIIEGYYIDHGAGDTIWYNIRSTKMMFVHILMAEILKKEVLLVNWTA